ncbi:hypothetical protein LC612_35375 [Nostoc sp. CHAB 5834]|nr:hypothetical protein [Nostoc sp. CHAB 5834]
MLYDKRTSAPAVITYEGVSPDDVKDFCEAMNFTFDAVGTRADWNDPTGFRVATHEYPSRGYDVRFSKVVEWKEAMAQMGPRVVQGGLYRNPEGEMFHTVCSALTSGSNFEVVVYKDAQNQHWTLPIREFFSVTKESSRLAPRFAYVGPVTA